MRLATRGLALLLVHALSASVRAGEVGGDFRISDMGPDGNGNFDGEAAKLTYNPTADEYLVDLAPFQRTVSRS